MRTHSQAARAATTPLASLLHSYHQSCPYVAPCSGGGISMGGRGRAHAAVPKRFPTTATTHTRTPSGSPAASSAPHADIIITSTASRCHICSSDARFSQA
mmetsp:Transcript_110919/g.155708  ORF Transcript_110919/g.155708 Transcript_110919/m.155708 type:complete len:100 (-) Transcript_110919:928-1227(-)